jgi:hypothetical protein
MPRKVQVRNSKTRGLWKNCHLTAALSGFSAAFTLFFFNNTAELPEQDSHRDGITDLVDKLATFDMQHLEIIDLLINENIEKVLRKTFKLFN